MPTLRIRFVGRFLFVPEDPSDGQDSCARMHVFGMDMQFNPSLDADPHHMLLSVPSENVAERYPEPYATMVTAEPADANVHEYLMWNLAKCSLSINASGPTPVTMAFKETHRIGGSVKSTAFHPTPAGVPAAFRFSTPAGDFKELVLDQALSTAEPAPGGRKDDRATRPEYELVSLGGKTYRKSVVLPDGIAATFEVEEAVLDLRGFRGSSSRAVQLVEARRGQPIICAITNTCGEHERGGIKDAEFAAYYDMLTDIPAVQERIVPRRLTPMIRGASGGRCYKQAIGSMPV